MKLASEFFALLAEFFYFWFYFILASLSQFYFLVTFYFHILYSFHYLLPLIVVFQSSLRDVFTSFLRHRNIFIIALSKSLSCASATFHGDHYNGLVGFCRGHIVLCVHICVFALGSRPLGL